MNMETGEVIRRGAAAFRGNEGRDWIREQGEEVTAGALALAAQAVPPPGGQILGALIALGGFVLSIFGRSIHRDREVRRLSTDRKRVAELLGIHPRDLAWYVGRMLWGDELATWQTQGPPNGAWPDGTSGRLPGINGSCGRGVTCEIRKLKEAKAAIALLESRIEAFGADAVRAELDGVPFAIGSDADEVDDIMHQWESGDLTAFSLRADGPLDEPRIRGALAVVASHLYGQGHAELVELLSRDQWRSVGSFSPMPDRQSAGEFLVQLLGAEMPNGERLLSFVWNLGAPFVGDDYGDKWGTTRPPGLSAAVRRTGAVGSAMAPTAVCALLVAVELELEEPARFVETMVALCDNESGCTFGLPAHTYNDLPERQRRGASRITAWGALQFNAGAWTRLFAPIAYLDEDEPAVELAARIATGILTEPGEPFDVATDHRMVSFAAELLPAVVHYGHVFRQGERMQGDGASAVWLMHNGPAYLLAWLEDGYGSFEAAERDARRQRTNAEVEERRAGHEEARSKAQARTSPANRSRFADLGHPMLGLLWSAYTARMVTP